MRQSTSAVNDSERCRATAGLGYARQLYSASETFTVQKQVPPFPNWLQSEAGQKRLGWAGLGHEICVTA